MSNPIDLKKHKSKKLNARIAQELEAAIKVMELAYRGLRPFGKYASVMEVMSSLKNNQTLLEVHLSKYKRMQEKDNETKLEKDQK